MKKTATAPRVVVVTRPTSYEALLARHGTREQARFFLETRGRDIAQAESQHGKQEAALALVSRAVPSKVRRASVTRADLSRFVFEPDDVVVCVGQDGLVANVAKYLAGQIVLGFNPDPSQYDGVLAKHRVERAAELVGYALDDDLEIEERTMVEALTDDGQRLVALNEIFVGHRTHQSARYRLRFRDAEERHSSSGVVVSTGTGATGWASSICAQTHADVSLPAPEDPRLVFLVREAFASVSTGTKLVVGAIERASALTVVSEMDDGGTLFGDGIEDDAIDLRWGLAATVRVAEKTLCLGS